MPIIRNVFIYVSYNGLHYVKFSFGIRNPNAQPCTIFPFKTNFKARRLRISIPLAGRTKHLFCVVKRSKMPSNGYVGMQSGFDTFHHLNCIRKTLAKLNRDAQEVTILSDNSVNRVLNIPT